MLVKEYRISLPLSVDEYRIAQLYMIQKKSREESSGAESGVEILINEPYKDGPGGSGQYTHKVYHIGSHLPGWFRALLPKSALQVEEEAWNAYPYTKTIYRCPFIEKFMLEIETKYLNDGGQHENVFNLSAADQRNRVVDCLDIVKDPISTADYKRDEDPKLYKSQRTGRGPLTDSWLDEHVQANKKQGGKTIMCAYKLCRVEFRYWGMQSKIERFIHDIGLRKTMLRAHRQAWCWQDEYYGLTMSDIRRLERETQLALQEKMENFQEAENLVCNPSSPKEEDLTDSEIGHDAHARRSVVSSMTEVNPAAMRHVASLPVSGITSVRKESRVSSGSSRNLADWKMDSIEQLRTSSSDEDEFFDAAEEFSDAETRSPTLFKSSSMEILSAEEDFTESQALNQSVDSLSSQESAASSSLDRRMEQYRHLQASHSIDVSLPNTPTSTTAPTCTTTILFLVLHGGSILDTSKDQQMSKRSDLSTFKTTLDTVIRAHYPAIHGHIAVRLVQCPPACTDTLTLLASLKPYSFDAQSPTVDYSVLAKENLPIGAISLFATGSPEYHDLVLQVIARTNCVYSEFLKSDEGLGFNGQVCLLADSVASIMGYDALCKNNPYVCSRNNSHHGSQGSLHEDPLDPEPTVKRTNLEAIKQVSISNPDLTVTDDAHPNNPIINNATVEPERKSSYVRYSRHASCPTSRRTSTGSQGELGKFDFEVSDFFMLGSSLGLVLAYRKMCRASDRSNVLPRPNCHQIYNMFYPCDPSAVRLEPLINDRFKFLDPMKVARYQKFPLGDGQSIHVVESIQSNVNVFLDQHASQGISSHSQDQHPPLERRPSNMSISSQSSGQGDLSAASIASITNKWWGNKRLDYALYSPEALQSFPQTALPYLLHASFWESSDAIGFILRQVVRQEYVSMTSEDTRHSAAFKPSQPREKWLKRRTTIKLRNVAPNHRANDVIVLEQQAQVLAARFMYGPLDMVSLSTEKVDVHIMNRPPSGEWQYYGTETTDNNGRAVYRLPDDKKLSQGMYPVKMVVRGDHTSVDFYLTVLPPMTETVVFSIDGSFTASMSIMGKDPKVRASSVDVVRHWQELGYLILYISARPDMQQKKVVAWLAQHNFPHGMVAFMDGLSADPLRQKANYLKQLIQEAKIKIHAAYGSSKDLVVYQAVSLAPEQTYIVGKVSKKHYKDAVVISEGYAAHLNELSSEGASRQAVGNARMFLRKSCFSLPGQSKLNCKKALHKTASLPPRCAQRDGGHTQRLNSGPSMVVSPCGNTVLEGSTAGSVLRPRGSRYKAKTRLDSAPQV